MLTNLYLGVDPRLLGSRLQAARSEANLTQQVIAERLHISRPTLVAIEKGDRLPKEEELIQFAEIYGHTVHELLRPQEPTTPPELQYRRSGRTDAVIEEAIKEALRKIQAKCSTYRWLEKQLKVPSPVLQAPMYALPPGASPARIGEVVAQAERNRLGLGDAPIKDLLGILEEEEEGLSIFQVKLPSPVAGFFGFIPSLGPFIALNLNHPGERRQWTLAHEYDHFLTNRHDNEVLVQFTYKQKPEGERFADAFADAFLMPATSVTRRFYKIKRAEGVFQPADISRLAYAFCVSFEAMARRLEELRLIQAGTYDHLMERGYHHTEALEHLRLEPYRMGNRPYPLRYEFLVGMAREKYLITEDQAMEYLGVDRTQVRHRLQALRTQAVLSESGQVSTVEIQLTDEKGA